MTDQLPALTFSGAPILPLLFVVGFVWLSLAIGRRLLIWLGVGSEGSLAERGVVAVALGAGTLQFVPFVLGAVGLLGITGVRIAVGALAVVLARDLWFVAARAWSGLRHSSRPNLWLLGLVLALAVALLIQALLALLPTFDADGVIYHLTVPKRWLASGSLDFLPTYPYSNAPMGVEMLYTIALAFSGDVAAKCLHFSLGILAALGLYLAGRRFRGSAVGAAAATLFLIGPVGVGGQLGTAYIEGATTLPLAAAAVAWLVWFQTRQQGWLRCAMLLGGVAVSFKLTSGLFPIALVALTYVALRVQQGRPARWTWASVRATFAPVARLVPLIALPVLPWLTRSALVTGNPFYPVLAQWIPSRDLSPASAAEFDQYNRYMLWGTSLGAGLTLDQRKLILLAIGVVLVLVVGVVVARLRSPLLRATAVVFLATVLTQMYAVGLYTRYWIPIAAVLTLPVLGLLSPLLNTRLMRAALIAVVAVVSSGEARTVLAHGDATPFNLSGLVRTAAGIDDRRVFLDRYQTMFPLYEQANRDLAPDAHILLTSYCSGFYIDRTTYCAEFVQDSVRFTNWNEFDADLRRLGVTHVIAPSGVAEGVSITPLLTGSVAMIGMEQRFALVGRLLGSDGRLLAQAGGEGLYALDRGLRAQTP